MKRKILLYSTNYYPEMTGIAKYNTEMAEWLVSNGYEVDVFTAMPSYPEWEIHEKYKNKKFIKETINGVHVYRSHLYVPNRKNTTSLKRLYMQFSFTINSLRYWVPKYIKKNEYDLVIGLCPPLLPQINAIIYKWLKKTPILLHVQDLEFDAAIRLGIIKQKRLSNLLNSIEVFFFNRVNIISSITYSMIERIKEKRLKSNNFFFFPNWSDINYITPLPKRNSFRELITENKDEKVVMYSGNIGKKQGLEIVLTVAEMFKKKSISNIKFVFVGDGVAKEELLKRKSEANLSNVIFLPVQPLEKLPELLASADIHLVIQKREAADLVMPSKLTNILSAGRTVIGTAEPGTALYEVIENSNSGIVIQPENSEVLFSTIEKLINLNTLNNYEVNARKYAEKYLDKEVILHQFDKFIKEFLIKREQ